MARFTPKRVCRNCTVVVVIVIIYFSLSFDKDNPIEYSEEVKSKTLLVDDFWVPEKRLAKVTGPGDAGRPVHGKPDEEELMKQSYVEYGFNQFISDKISLNRTVPDTRPRQ